MKDKITGHTVLTGLLGSPVAHSISPMMHNESFRQLGLDYAYLAFDVGTDNLKTAVEGLKVLGVRGFNLMSCHLIPCMTGREKHHRCAHGRCQLNGFL